MYGKVTDLDGANSQATVTTSDGESFIAYFHNIVNANPHRLELFEIVEFEPDELPGAFPLARSIRILTGTEARRTGLERVHRGPTGGRRGRR
jgi:hypothetical protein